MILTVSKSTQQFVRYLKHKNYSTKHCQSTTDSWLRTLDPTKSKSSWIFQWIFFLKKWNAQNSLLCKIHMNPCLGHSVWILAERAMPLFFTWYSLQAAPRSESSTFQSCFFHLLKCNVNVILHFVLNKGRRQFGGPSGWLLHWTGWELLTNNYWCEEW